MYRVLTSLQMKTEIHIIPSQEVDVVKWDNRIRSSGNGIIYALASFLTGMTDQWTGIIVNNYELVMPVPWRKKFGVKYCYDAPFLQQSGWFGKADVTADMLLQELFRICKYGNYHFNAGNDVKGTTLRNNFILPLNPDYASIQSTFSTEALQHIRKAEQSGLSYKAAGLDEAILMYRELYGERLSNISSSTFERFAKLAKLYATEDRAIARKVITQAGTTVAIQLLLKDERRMYNIMPSTTKEGRKLNASYFLFASLWKEFANSNLIFDFEGSDIPGVKAFYEKFSPIPEPYQRLHFNNLSWPVRLFKK
jgi:hypothetical protein